MAVWFLSCVCASLVSWTQASSVGGVQVQSSIASPSSTSQPSPSCSQRSRSTTPRCFGALRSSRQKRASASRKTTAAKGAGDEGTTGRRKNQPPTRSGKPAPESASSSLTSSMYSAAAPLGYRTSLASSMSSKSPGGSNGSAPTRLLVKHEGGGYLQKIFRPRLATADKLPPPPTRTFHEGPMRGNAIMSSAAAKKTTVPKGAGDEGTVRRRKNQPVAWSGKPAPESASSSLTSSTSSTPFGDRASGFRACFGGKSPGGSNGSAPARSPAGGGSRAGSYLQKIARGLRWATADKSPPPPPPPTSTFYERPMRPNAIASEEQIRDFVIAAAARRPKIPLYI